jgi:dynein heavy chain
MIKYIHFCQDIEKLEEEERLEREKSGVLDQPVVNPLDEVPADSNVGVDPKVFFFFFFWILVYVICNYFILVFTLLFYFYTSPQEYEDLENYDSIKPVVEECLELYNDSHIRMNLVMFADALSHLARIHRIIRMCRGNALLIGYGGSGKQSLTMLAAYLARYKVFQVCDGGGEKGFFFFFFCDCLYLHVDVYFQITLSRGYNDASFREDLKKLYHMLGVENKEVVFLFTDAHVVDNSFLEYVNSMLTSGNVPALYTEEEKDVVIRDLQEEMVKRGIFYKEQCWNYFISKCRNNLHVVLCMSPAGLKRNRIK